MGAEEAVAVIPLAAGHVSRMELGAVIAGQALVLSLHGEQTEGGEEQEKTEDMMLHGGGY
jgi:hypothetical protein